MPSNDLLSPAQREALEARFALRVRSRLDEGALALPHDISERLRVAREQAIATARQTRACAVAAQAVIAPVTVVNAGMTLAGGPGISNLPFQLPSWRKAKSAVVAEVESAQDDDKPFNWLWRLALLAPVVALLVGLWAIHRYQQHEHVEATTAVDIELLVDDLPPDAYADPGFEAYMTMIDADPDFERLVDTPVEISGDLMTADTAPAVSAP